MKNILITFSLLFAFVFSSAQTISHSAGITYGTGAPTHTPNGTVSKVYFDVTNVKLYDWSGSTWKVQGEDIDRISGCAAPNYVPGLGDSHLALNGCTTPFTPQLYAFVGPLASNWVLISGYNAGEGINIANGTISLGVLDRVRFSQNPSLAGGERIIRWNDTDGTLEFGMKGGNVIQPIGQNNSFLVKHADNLSLVKGRAVYLAGSTGQNKTVRYAMAISEATSSTTFGVMAENATTGQNAFCTTVGYVRDINTMGLKEGGLVWLSAAPDSVGGLTAVRPQAPNHGVLIGLCVRKHQNQGVIYVNVQNGHELYELHDVFISNLKNRQVLSYDSLQLRWENTNLKTLVNQAVGVASITGNTKQIAFNNSDSTIVGSDSLVWDFTNRRLGINITNPNYTIHAKGAGYRLFNEDGLRLDLVNQDAVLSFPIVTSIGSSDDSGFIGTTSSHPFEIRTGGTEKVIVTETGQVGINLINAPVTSAQLEVRSSSRGFLPPRMTQTNIDNIPFPENGLILYNSTTHKLQVYANGVWVDLH